MNADQQAALREQFPAHLIGKLPKGGRDLDFVGHGAVTDRLLAIDPEWNWEPFAVDEAGLPALDEFGNLWIRLTICGVTRPGVGDGPNMKERIGDAIRNAAMRFGVALDLWIRGHGEDFTQQEQTRRPRPSSSSNERRELVEQCTARGLPTNGSVEELRARLAGPQPPVEGEASASSVQTMEDPYAAARKARAEQVAEEAGLADRAEKMRERVAAGSPADVKRKAAADV